MEAWAIFKHAVRMVFGNFGDALRVTGVLYVLSFVIPLVIFGHNFAYIPFSIDISSDLTVHFEAGGSRAFGAVTVQWFEGLTIFALHVILYIWIAIAWHRYILLGEKRRLIPRFPGADLGQYFGGLLVVAVLGWMLSKVLIILAGYLLNIISGLLPSFNLLTMAQNPSTSLIIALSIFGPILFSLPQAFVALRYAPLFPAIALARQLEAGKTLELGQALDKTSGQNKTLLIIAMASVLTVALVGICGQLIAPLGVVASNLYIFLFAWLKVVLGISIITTIYQRCVSETGPEEA